MTMRSLVLVTCLVLTFSFAAPPAAALTGPAPSTGGHHTACAASLATPAGVAGVNCGKVSYFNVNTYCSEFSDGAQYCHATYQGEVDAYQWLGAGEISATLSGHCDSAGLRSWAAFETLFFNGVYGPNLYCSGPGVIVAAGSCHTFEATLEGVFNATLAPPVVTQNLAVEVCA